LHFLSHIPDSESASEMIDTTHALGRVTAAQVAAPHPLPAFDRSAMDGYAVRAVDTFGASESLPGYLKVIGEVTMGAQPGFEVHAGEAALIHTGGMLPSGADAVVMLEYTQVIDRRDRGIRGVRSLQTSEMAHQRLETLDPIDSVLNSEIEIGRAVAVGENILQLGEDVAQGEVVIPVGKRIRPAEIGGLMALGLTEVLVAKPPRVGLISSGDEVIPPQHNPLPGQVRDINSYTLAALVVQYGGEPVSYGIIPDDLETLKQTAKRALGECDMLVITAGSSASARDMTAEAIRSLGEPGVLVHGVNIRPGKPTILAVCNRKAVIGLPGNPVSALVIASLFVIPAIEKLLGLPVASLRPTILAKLTLNIPSQAGREEWAAVRLKPSPLTLSRGTPVGLPKGEDEWLAEPVFSKSNLIFSLVAAHGLVRIPADATGISAGEIVEVVLM
jgi:molybdopterin molybdotransferase